MSSVLVTSSFKVNISNRQYSSVETSKLLTASKIENNVELKYTLFMYQTYPFFIAMLRKSLKPGFSFKNTFSTSSLFEILNHGTKKIHEDQLKDE